MKNKLLLLFVMTVCCTCRSLAQTWDDVRKITQVQIWGSDSTYAVYKCSDHPVVYADQTGLVLKVNGTQVVYPASEARKFTFLDDPTRIEKAVSKGTFEVTQTTIKAEGLEPNVVVAIYDIAGRLVVQKKAFDGAVAIDISNYLQGVYVVKAGSTNFKFMKR